MDQSLPNSAVDPSNSAPSEAPLNNAQDIVMADTSGTEGSVINVNPLAKSRSTSMAPPGTNDTPPPSSFGMPQLSASTEEILQRVAAARNVGFDPGTPGYEAAKLQVLRNMKTSDSITVASPSVQTPISTSTRGGRGGRRGGAAVKLEDNTTPSVTTPGNGRGRGRGRGSGRGKGRGRGGRGKVGKRKRGSDDEDDGDDDADDTDSSDEQTPLPTTTKSGRSVNKPTSYVPIIQSPLNNPTSSTKRRRTGGRHPSAASKCKICQRGHSPQENQIVFCDSCNIGYHQYCHHPPIEKDVVLVLDKEWICGNCTRQKDRDLGGAPVDAPKVTRGEKYFSGERWTGDEKRRYFESLPHSVAVDLLFRSTVLYPTIPIFPSIPGLYEPSEHLEQTNGINGIHTEDVEASPVPDFFDDDPPTHYPKPGFGLARMLPPESEHLQFLVDENTGVFSHFFPAEQLRPANGEAVEISAGITVR